MAEIVPIPEPPGLPFLGNLPGFGIFGKPSISNYADQYGPIFRVRFAGQSVVVISSYELINEVCDERRFHKSLKTVLRKVREGVHDALFTAPEGSEDWDRAHRILIPAFGPLNIRGMFDEMYDVASQMALKFARHGPQASILTSDDFSKLTLGTIALCSMDYRFNSFYSDDLHPFIRSMIDFLTECERRHKRPAFLPDLAFRAQNEKFFEDIEVMRRVATEVVEARKQQQQSDQPSERGDLLTAMLSGKDPKTGEKLADDNIRDNLITFLIAGHETTSGLLCFAFYHLLKNPDVYHKVQEEVEQVVGRGRITVEHISKFRYIQAVLREALRVTSTIPAFALEPYEDTLLAGKYPLKAGEPINCLIHRSHIDPAVHGPDAKEFKPERMIEENFNALNAQFPNFWKPFGNGKRSCIGRAFAWQEAVLCVAMMFQNFDFEMVDPQYELKIARTLTVKPEDFKMRARLRHGMSPTELERRLAGSGGTDHQKRAKKRKDGAVSSGSKKPIAVYYGSDGGTCEAMAQRLAADAPSQGFSALTASPLDEAKGRLPTDRPVVIITASYEGQPPANAKEFVSWIEDDLHDNQLQGVNYAVYGCGHRDWHSTFHRIPHLIDSTLEKRGGTRLVPFSGTDAADKDIFSDFETWEDTSLWPALRARYGVNTDINGDAKGLSVEISTPRHEVLKQDVQEAVVISESILTAPGAPAKKHIEIQLPIGMDYQTGDYLAVLPFNPPDTVDRVMRRFELARDATIKVSADIPTSLPIDCAISVKDALGGYVELGQPATKKYIATLIENTTDPEAKHQLEILGEECFGDQISSKHVSILDLLERFPSIALSFSVYLSMLPPIRIRQYSISSSPKADPSSLTLTYSVFTSPTPQSLPSPPPSPPLSTWSQTLHIGVATSFLSSLRPGDKLPIAVRKSTLRPPPTSTPVVCIAAGSGLAPFRAFIQERALAVQSKEGRNSVAPALLLFGCRHPDQDSLYAPELSDWESQGAVSVRRAYSRASEQSEGCNYVQERLWHERDEVWKMWKAGAKLYVCGGREMGHAVEEMFLKIARKAMEGEAKGMDGAKAKAWLDSQRRERFAMDLFD